MDFGDYNSQKTLFKVKEPTQIYMLANKEIYFLGSTSSIREQEKFNVNTSKKLLSHYKFHDIFDGKDSYDIIYNKDIVPDICINQTLIARNYIWDIKLGQLCGFRYTILENASIVKLKDDNIKVESKTISRIEKYIYL